MTALPFYNGLPYTYAAFQFIDCPPAPELKKPFYNGRLRPADEGSYEKPQYKIVTDIPIYDVRGHEHKFDLQTHGFCFQKHAATANIKPTSDKVSIEQYISGLAAILKEQQQAELVFCYDYKFRRNDDEARSRRDHWNDRSYFDPPAREAHVDATLEGAPHRIRRALTEAEAAKYLDGSWRLRIVNGWQPVGYGVEDQPLAFCDYFTTRQSDYVKIHMHVSSAEDGEGELYHLRHDEGQVWYWLSAQTNDEVMFFVNFDSNPGDGRRCEDMLTLLCPFYQTRRRSNSSIFFWCLGCPHSSFYNSSAPDHARPRQSIETRFAVISKNDAESTGTTAEVGAE